MATFSKNSIEKLDECHIELKILFSEVIKHFDCSVICGHRGKAEQNTAYDHGYSTKKFPESKHNTTPAIAVDVVPYPIEWDNTNRMRLFAGFVMGIAKMMKEHGKMTYSVRWGGDWDSDTKMKDQRFDDLPHFELIP